MRVVIDQWQRIKEGGERNPGGRIRGQRKGKKEGVTKNLGLGRGFGVEA